MERKYSLQNILRAIDFIVAHKLRSDSFALEAIRSIKWKIADKERMCEQIKGLVGIGDKLIEKRSGLNSDVIYRVFRRDTNRYIMKQSRRIKFYELVIDLLGNYRECRTHMMCATTTFPENLPGYRKNFEDPSKWYVLPGAPKQLKEAFAEDSGGKIHGDFMTYADKLQKRTDSQSDVTFSPPAPFYYRHVQAMVYTGTYHRMYPIVLMLTLDITPNGKALYFDGRKLPHHWIPIMVRIPRKPREKSAETNEQGETR